MTYLWFNYRIAVEFRNTSPTNRDDPKKEFAIIVNESYARDKLRSRISSVAQGINSRFHLTRNDTQPLISLTEDPLVKLSFGYYNEKLDRDTLQNVNLEVMREFGFDENSFVKDNHSTPIIETLIFPSDKINGLVFRRITIGDENGPSQVLWLANDETPPLSQRLKRLIPGRSRKIS